MKWDEAKRQANLKRHGFDFVAVEEIFGSDVLTLLDNRFDYDEVRFLTLGVFHGTVVSIAHTETDEVIRIISFRKASKDEEEIYYKEIRD